MGLDCYIRHGNDHDKAFTQEDDERLKDINLCGGMLSGSGSDGSFRGKVYEPLIDDLMSMSDEDFNGCGIWHKSEHDNPPYVTSDELKEQADALADFIQLKVDIADEDGIVIGDDDIIYSSGDGYNEYTYREVWDLLTLLRVASERKAVMHVWW
tara:strand:+ start:465 stop:926 length:462 start_codon:yes stop_codon:yes gene_type:complete